MYSAFWLWAIAQALLLPNWVAGFAGLVGFGTLYFGRVAREERMILENFATAIAPTWSGPAGFSRQYAEIIGVPILQHSPKKRSRDCQFGCLLVAWVERPAKFRVGKG